VGVLKQREMKKLKENLQISLIILGLVSIIGGIGYVKYKIWRAEHPQAKTWTFFIPNGSNH
jgi:cell division protein FtsB